MIELPIKIIFYFLFF